MELDIDELINKLPFLGKSLKNDQQKAAMQRYFKDRVCLLIVLCVVDKCLVCLS